ncbi:unnamed protein product [Clavelina lepadiformis]|uniref:Tyrosine-protein kinase n=1 Tax=Clavelina lepadiformis TaxID=159417 RepID=A0ABP0GP95_CLALP
MAYEAAPLPGNIETIKNDQCYFGKISRSLAEDFLNERGKIDGTFLVREGGDGLRLSVLETRRGLRTVGHYKITQKSNKTYYIDPKQPFPTVAGLIGFYKNMSNSAALKLTHACLQIDDVTMEDVGSAVTRSMLSDIKKIKREAVSMTTQLMNGKFSNVWKGKLTTLDDYVVIKTQTDNEASQRYIAEEAYALNVLRHKNVIRSLGVVPTKPVCVILEYEDNGDLLDYLLRSDTYEMPAQQRIRLALEISSALHHISRMNCVHRNVRASNVLLDKYLSCKLTGFGFAARMNQQGVYFGKPGDKPFPNCAIRWMALEGATAHQFSTSSDVWSFGGLLIELFSNGEAPFSEELTPHILDKVKRGLRSPRPLGMSDALYSLTMRCWYPDPNTRPTFTMIQEILTEYTDSPKAPLSPQLLKEFSNFKTSSMKV